MSTTYYDTRRLPYHFDARYYKLLSIGDESWNYFLGEFPEYEPYYSKARYFGRKEMIKDPPYIYAVSKVEGCLSNAFGSIAYFPKSF